MSEIEKGRRKRGRESRASGGRTRKESERKRERERKIVKEEEREKKSVTVRFSVRGKILPDVLVGNSGFGPAETQLGFYRLTK